MSAAEPLELLVRTLDDHVALPPQDVAAILALRATIRTLPASTYLLREGERPGTGIVLLEGFAYRHKLTDLGGRQIVSLLIPGDPLDLQHLFLDRADHNIQALTPVTVAAIARADLQAIALAHPAVARAFTVHALIEASIMREWMTNIGRRDARQRLAHLLCEVARRLERRRLTDDYGYQLPMTQEQLGDALGLTAVHVNRTLKALEAGDLIARTRRSIAFPGWERMRREAGFNDAYLHPGRQSAP